TEESEEVKRLRREVAELKRANEILKAASLDSTRQRNSASNLSAGVSKSRVLERPANDVQRSRRVIGRVGHRYWVRARLIRRRITVSVAAR
ncbi:hypothetical protein SAMN05216207_11601, partial [Pseudonocardia ammonioxydans]